MASEHGVAIAFDYDLVVETVAVQPSSESCQIERSEPEARSGKMWVVHASADEKRN